MKEVNAYYRKHGKLDGCALLSPDQIEKLKASMASSWRSDPRPFESYQLTNNNAEIRRVKARIEQLSKQAQIICQFLQSAAFKLSCRRWKE